MFKTKEFTTDYKIAVDINTLQSMLCVGKNTAIKIGKAAGAEIKLGRRSLYNVKKVEEYMDQITGQDGDDLCQNH